MQPLRIVSLVIGLTGVMAGTLVSASPATASDGDVIFSPWSNQCLQPVDGSTEQGAAIVQQPCCTAIVQQPCDEAARLAQQWARKPVSGNIFHFQNGLSHMCLDARGGATNGTPVQQWTCNSISNENWEVNVEDFDRYDIPPPLFSRVSGTRSHCLDMPGAQRTAGLAMQTYRCNGTEAQQWWSHIDAKT